MPSLIDMRRRIRAVKSTQQITKAMKMVAASKLRRAQASVIATRPFAIQARRVLASIATRIDEEFHPLLAKRPGSDNGAALVIINREPTDFDDIADLVVRNDIGDALSPFIAH